MTQKSQMCEDTKTEYANQLQKTNDLRRSHFNLSLPEVFRQLQVCTHASCLTTSGVKFKCVKQCMVNWNKTLLKPGIDLKNKGFKK